MRSRRALLVALVLSSPWACAAHRAASGPQPPDASQATLPSSIGSQVTTLVVFGLSSDDGVGVSAQAWAKFLDDTVAPRFPDGFTVLDALGHYRGAPEASKVMLVVRALTSDSERRISEIAETYKTRFRQHSVLHVNLPTVAVSERPVAP